MCGGGCERQAARAKHHAGKIIGKIGFESFEPLPSCGRGVDTGRVQNVRPRQIPDLVIRRSSQYVDVNGVRKGRTQGGKSAETEGLLFPRECYRKHGPYVRLPFRNRNPGETGFAGARVKRQSRPGEGPDTGVARSIDGKNMRHFFLLN